MRLRAVLQQLKGFGWKDGIMPSFETKEEYEDLLLEEVWWDGFNTAKGEKSKWNKPDSLKRKPPQI